MRPKRLPRLWCALQGLLPFEVSAPAWRATSASRLEPALLASPRARPAKELIRVAVARATVDGRPRGPI